MYEQQPIEENLFLNTLAFDLLQEPITFYFSMEDRDFALTKLNHALFPKNVRTIFPNITNADTLYTSFTKQFDGFLPLEITFADNFGVITAKTKNEECENSTFYIFNS